MYMYIMYIPVYMYMYMYIYNVRTCTCTSDSAPCVFKMRKLPRNYPGHSSIHSTTVLCDSFQSDHTVTGTYILVKLYMCTCTYIYIIIQEMRLGGAN